MHRIKGAVRLLTLRPVLAVVIVLTLALGIGANAAMFSLFHEVLLRPLPVPDSDRLVNLASPGPKLGSVSWDNMGGGDYVFSYPMLHDLEREQTVFTGIAAHHAFSASPAFTVLAVVILGFGGATLYMFTVVNAYMLTPLPYPEAACIMHLVALFASLLPALRALRVNPLEALRHE